MSHSDLSFLAELEAIVQERLNNPRSESYTSRLAAEGTRRIAQKVGEEAIEFVLAATAGDSDETIDEAADLVYHIVVLLTQQGLCLTDIAKRLELRHSQPS